MTVTVAAVQATPVFLDREATADKVCALVKEAAGHGAELVVFPESFVPAYPDWVWRTPAWRDGEFVKRFYANAVRVPGPTLDRIGEAAAEASAYVVIGVTEVDGGTLYNTLLYLGPGRTAGAAAPQAHADGWRADGVGDGRRLRARRRAHAVRRRRRAALLGELHAAGPGRDLRAALRHLPGADVGQQRHLGRHAAAHRQGGQAVRHRRRPAAARLGRARGAARRALRARRRLDVARPHDHRRARAAT